MRRRHKNPTRVAAAMLAVLLVLTFTLPMGSALAEDPSEDEQTVSTAAEVNAEESSVPDEETEDPEEDPDEDSGNEDSSVPSDEPSDDEPTEDITVKEDSINEVFSVPADEASAEEQMVAKEGFGDLSPFTSSPREGGIRALTKTVSENSNEDGELDITLTVSGATVTKNQPLYLLLVIDLSGSMNNTLSGGITRLQALRNAFAGSFIDDLSAKVGDGNLNVDIVTFGSTAANTLDWTNDLDTVKSTILNLNAPTDNGTNYQQALAVAQDAAASRSDVHVIFLSDGQPTQYGTNASGNGKSCDIATLNATLAQMESFAQDPNISFRSAIAYAMNPSFTTDSAIQGRGSYRFTDVNLLGPAGSYASGTYQYRRFITWANGSADQNLETLTIPTIGYDAFHSADDEAELLDSLNAIVKGFNLSNVSITDPMDQTYIEEQIDLEGLQSEGKLKVYLDEDDGTSIQLEYSTDYTVANDTVYYIPELLAGQTLRVVATVKMSGASGDWYFQKQSYPDEDADGNPGFFSNGAATATGTVDQDEYTGDYPNPVFQLNTTSLTIRKVSEADESQSLPNATFTITRKDSTGASVTRTESYTTGEDGTVEIANLPYGDYVLEETSSPSGFQILDDPITFSVNYLGEITGKDELSLSGNAKDGYSMVVTNVPSTFDLVLLKTDSAGSLLSGVDFELSKLDDDSFAIRELMTNEDGTVLLEGLTAGEYRLKETKTLEGYALPTGQAGIIINADGSFKVFADGEIICSQTDKGLRIVNQQSFKLPSAGVNGTNRFLIAGGILVFAGVAAVIGVLRKH